MTPRVTTSTGSEVARLDVRLPESATVYIGEAKTKSTGVRRRYEWTGLRPGQFVTFQVRAEMTHNGRKLEETRSIDVRAGSESTLALNFDEIETTLTLEVPSDAKVYLGDLERKGQGPVRFFSTKRLARGKKVSDYAVRVSVVREGKLITKERKISLKSGDARRLAFDFTESPRVAVVP